MNEPWMRCIYGNEDAIAFCGVNSHLTSHKPDVFEKPFLKGIIYYQITIGNECLPRSDKLYPLLAPQLWCRSGHVGVASVASVEGDLGATKGAINVFVCRQNSTVYFGVTYVAQNEKGWLYLDATCTSFPSCVAAYSLLLVVWPNSVYIHPTSAFFQTAKHASY